MILIYFTDRNINFHAMERKNIWKQMQKRKYTYAKTYWILLYLKYSAHVWLIFFCYAKIIILVTKKSGIKSQNPEGCCNIL